MHSLAYVLTQAQGVSSITITVLFPCLSVRSIERSSSSILLPIRSLLRILCFFSLSVLIPHCLNHLNVKTLKYPNSVLKIFN